MGNILRQIATLWLIGLVAWSIDLPANGAEADAWSTATRIWPVYGNYRFSTSWNPKTGMALRIAEAEGSRHVTCRLHPHGSSFADWTGDPSSRKYAFLAFGANLPRTAEKKVEVTVKVRAEGWSIYVDRELAAMLKPGLTSPLALQLENNAAVDGPVRFQKVAPFSFSSTFMDAGNSQDILTEWDTAGGQWKIHTANQDAVAESTSSKLMQQPLNAEHSPNFYNLQATGTGMLLTGHEFEDDYSVSASVKSGGGGAGLVFCQWGERDYHVLQLEPMGENDDYAVVTLFRQSARRIPRYERLGVVKVPLTSGQWVSLEARATGTRLVCLLDDRVLFDRAETMPAGGRYGLYVDAAEGVTAEFDDFAARSIRDLELSNVFWTRFHAIDSERNLFEQESGLFRILGGGEKNPPDQTWINSNLSGRLRWIAIGAADHDPHRFGATFTMHSKQFDVGVLTGFTDRSLLHYRFRCSFDGDRFVRFLEEVQDNQVRTVATWDLPSSVARLGLRHRLELDIDDDGVVKAYHNGALVFVHHATSTQGGSGIYLGKATEAKISALTYSFEPRTELVNAYEKNPLFVTDRFMKHWSSPEGEWLADLKTGDLWHKSDAFGAYALTLPFVKGAEVHFSVEEGFQRSPVFLRIARDGTLELHSYGRVVAEGSLSEEAQDDDGLMAGNAAAFTVHYEDHCIWATCAGDPIFSYRMNHPLKGSRIGLKGYRQEHMAHCRTKREKVLDVLFTEALHEWTQAGGQWRVINRFKCQPEWSHMNGVNPDGTANLWGKKELKGDFCVEFFVGLQHGEWYTLPGRDFNVTVMNTEQSVGSGYTVTCSGWDEHETQRWTKLYKNGKLVLQSDAYTAPRIRDGNRRKRFEPIISRGRDVHGAWYYVKFRRIGSRLQYFFDNELILEWDDPSPIDAGSFGIWSYRNSMMVARVRVTADEVSSRRYPIKNLPRPPKPTPPKKSAAPTLLANTIPVDLMQPARWKSSLADGNCVTEWHTGRQHAYVVQRNVLGGGNVLLKPELPPLSIDSYAGVRFKVKRTEKALFDFHYSLRTPDGRTPDQRCLHGIAGDRLAGTERWRTFGSSSVEALSQRAFDRDGWTEVTVWFPAQTSASTVIIDGFGCLRPSLAQQGLTGNAPGSRFAIADFRLIHRNLPTVTPGKAPFTSLGVYGLGERRVTVATARLLEPRLIEFQHTGLNEVTFAPKRNGRTSFTWIHYPDAPELKVVADANVPRAMRIPNPLHDRRIASATATVDGTSLTFEESHDGSLFALMPLRLTTPTIMAKVSVNGTRHSLPVSGGPATYPVLTSLRGPVGTLIDPDIPGSVTGTLPKIDVRHDPLRRRYLHFRTGAYPDRLNATFPTRFNLATHPLMAFKYAADDTTWVSLVVGNVYGKFAEEKQNAAEPLAYSQVTLDGKWRHWLGKIGDVTIEAPFSKQAFSINRLRLASTSPATQTGSDSRLLLNGIVLGPAINAAEDLSFTPTFACVDGLKSVEYAVLDGPAGLSNRPDTFREKLTWTAVENGKPFQVSDAMLPKSVGWVVIRATSNRNVYSDLVEIPFLVDMIPPKPRSVVAAVSRLGTNGTVLSVIAPSAGGAPLDVSRLQVSVDGKPVSLSSRMADLKHTEAKDAIIIDWPYLMHAIGKDGGSATLTLSGIRDGAGNEGPDFTVTVPPKDFRDAVGPTWLAMDVTKAKAVNQNLLFQWTDPRIKTKPFLGIGTTKYEWIKAFGKTPYYRAIGRIATFGVFMKTSPTSWDLDTHPLVSLSYRTLKVTKTSTLELVMHSGRSIVTLPLPRENKGKANLTGWQTVTVNAREAFKKRGLAPRVSRITIQGRNMPREAEVHFRDFIIHRKWAPDDVVVPDAYDASGIDHVAWRYVVDGVEKASGKLPMGPVRPAILVPAGSAAGWLHLSMVDRKNNASEPIRLPVP